MQDKVISNVLNKKDTLAIMPTGSGKSICYQIPSQIFDGITIVISPLIALMKDQNEQMSQMGIGTSVLNSSLSDREYRNNIRKLFSGESKLLYIAPERLFLDGTQSILADLKIDCITIDEAHCISEWGHDFRPEYRRLVEVRAKYPEAVCLALTATATPRVQRDIKDILGFKDSNEFISSFDRTNLFLQVKPKNDPVSQTIEFISKFKNESGIIYCQTKKDVEKLSLTLNTMGFSTLPYHAGLEPSERSRNQDMFIKDDVNIIVATIAFGMGINKPDVRFILHYNLPKNIESYYQQVGRAGRDGVKSSCLLLYNYGDTRKIEYFIKEMKDAKEKEVAKRHLNAMVEFSKNYKCRRKMLLSYFGEDYKKDNCGMCDNCLEGPKDLEDLTIPAQKFLSCVKRTGEIFGNKYVIDVLRGSRSKRILDNRHDELSTYGIGKDFTSNQWLNLSDQILYEGLMVRDSEYGSLKITEKAWRLFRGEEKFYGFIIEDNSTSDKDRTKENKTYDVNMFEILRKKRKEIADESKIPPYAVFNDSTLIEMSTYFPRNKTSMIKISGVGEVKLEKYGDTFIKLIEDYCDENDIPMP